MVKTNHITSCGLNKYKRNPQHTKKYWMVISILMMTQIQTITAKFEPYELNGGLITAIAGKDYILIASDTRLSNGYEIQSRSHLSSRLWSVSSHEYSHLSEQSSSSSFDVFHSDGSLRTQPPPSSPSKKISNKEETISNRNIISSCDYEKNCDPPIFIGSSGCVADCIALQRQFRSEISAYTYWTGGKTNIFGSMNIRTTHLTPRQVSILLMNTLYNRRNFPFYSFCIVAGLNSKLTSGQDDHGAVYVYDAIGSNERVAVAAAGTGREMMQPILDRLFAVSNVREKENVNQNNFMERDGNAITAFKQKKGNILLPPVKTHVSLDCDESIDLLMRGYRSVAEREIAVGDDVVICLLKRKNEGGHSLELRKFPLKKH